MTKILNVYALPKLAAPEELAGGTAVVIDVLRASTTIVAALASGAEKVQPYQEVEEARAAAKKMADGEFILGGERGGLPIEGFHLGNSPEDYTPYHVGGRTVIFTTTNGTRAMLHAKRARRVLIGAFVNAAAIQRRLLEAEQIHLLCAGTDGEMSQDDILFAGMMVDRIVRHGGMPYRQNAQAMTARETWLSRFTLPQAIGAEPIPPDLLAAELAKSLGGKNLVELGLEADIRFASQIDHFDCVPEMERATLAIRAQ